MNKNQFNMLTPSTVEKIGENAFYFCENLPQFGIK